MVDTSLGRENRENERCASGGIKVMWTRYSETVRELRQSPPSSRKISYPFKAFSGRGEAGRRNATRYPGTPLVELGEGKMLEEAARISPQIHGSGTRTTRSGHHESRKWVGRGVALNFLTSAIRAPPRDDASLSREAARGAYREGER